MGLKSLQTLNIGVVCISEILPFWYTRDMILDCPVVVITGVHKYMHFSGLYPINTIQKVPSTVFYSVALN